MKYGSQKEKRVEEETDLHGIDPHDLLLTSHYSTYYFIRVLLKEGFFLNFKVRIFLDCIPE